MKHLIEMDHIGYAVRDIQETAAPYVAAGWELSEVYNEEVQHAKIAFLKKEGMTTIELVAPLFEGGGGTCRQNTSRTRDSSIPYLLYSRRCMGSDRRSSRRRFRAAFHAGTFCGYGE